MRRGIWLGRREDKSFSTKSTGGRDAVPIPPALGVHQRRRIVGCEPVCMGCRVQYGDAMKHFYRDVPRLGNVAVSRHAQARMEEDGIMQEAFDKVLLTPSRPDIPDGADLLWRERDGLRIVILTNPKRILGYAHISCRVRIGIRKRLRAYDAVRFGSLRQPEDTNRNGLVAWIIRGCP